MSKTANVDILPAWKRDCIIPAVPPEAYNLPLQCGAMLRLKEWPGDESWLSILVGGQVRWPLKDTKQNALNILIPQLEAALAELRDLEAQKGANDESHDEP